MKKIPVERAVGMILCQDITKIVPGEFKGRAFKKGHIIREEDIEELLKIGKEHVYVWEPRQGQVHEDEAALRIARAVAGDNIVYDEPVEGKTTLKSTVKGLFKVKSRLLYEINSIEYVTVASLPGNFAVEAGRKLAGARVIPLVIEEEKINTVEELCGKEGPVFEVKPYRRLKAGLITTGNEVYKGRIADKFGPVVRAKLEYFAAEYLGQVFCPDDVEKIREAIQNFKGKGADLIILTGGMSVDPDDLTPAAIRSTADRVVTYGAPVQPGNMFMMAYAGRAALIGVPGCAMYYRTTVLDAVLPRVFAGEILEKEDFIAMAEGGFCSGCEPCRYPNCYFCR
ncbi:molybdopterin-binding protein [Thermosediminibacter litoriperuensis]|uniref:Molybdopterin molybdenumtransferase n=1 Tax=Thermosediminibacter litoriperuensis TaxID=291989 RepID=A0A5S5AK95_9FIRM|nr:molybdopterin-binding protein [Thermosediminibacter litoriperuensis]TYP51590.1 molybdenum cofactor synthesis domain-containing protein [Thermosediminibacter litoriperuensis]